MSEFMGSTADFIVDGVISSSPDVARAELAQAQPLERKAHKVYDILAICEAADTFAEEVFADKSMVESVALLDCRYVDRYVALLEALGGSAVAADLHGAEYDFHQGAACTLPHRSATG